MFGITFEQAVDDYLRQIVRTRPWTRLHEEEVLQPFSAWMRDQHELAKDLSAVTPAVLRWYTLAANLSEDAASDLESVIGRMMVWADVLGYFPEHDTRLPGAELDVRSPASRSFGHHRQ